MDARHSLPLGFTNVILTRQFQDKRLRRGSSRETNAQSDTVAAEVFRLLLRPTMGTFCSSTGDGWADNAAAGALGFARGASMDVGDTWRQPLLVIPRQPAF